MCSALERRHAPTGNKGRSFLAGERPVLYVSPGTPEVQETCRRGSSFKTEKRYTSLNS